MIFRFAVHDTHNEWVRSLEIEADDLETAERRASSWLFTRRDVGVNIELTPQLTTGADAVPIVDAEPAPAPNATLFGDAP